MRRALGAAEDLRVPAPLEDACGGAAEEVGYAVVVVDRDERDCIQRCEGEDAVSRVRRAADSRKGGFVKERRRRHLGESRHLLVRDDCCVSDHTDEELSGRRDGVARPRVSVDIGHEEQPNGVAGS